MQTLIIKCLLFFSILFVADKGFLYFKITAPDRLSDKRLQKVLEGKIQDDVIIIGSSRGVEDINAWIIEDSLGIDCYNLSYTGCKMEWQYFIAESLLQFAKPNLIIKVLDEPREFLPVSDTFRIDELYPLVRYPVILDSLIAKGEKNYWLSKLFVTHQLSSSMYDPRTAPAPSAKEQQYGAESKSGTIKAEDKLHAPYGLTYHRSKEVKHRVDLFKRFQNLAASKGVSVAYIIPPNYHAVNREFADRIYELTNDSASVYTLPISLVPQRDLRFRDPSHLNEEGAEWFTKQIIPFLRAQIDGSR